MENKDIDKLLDLFSLKFKPHPWHGISIGEDAPEIVNAFIEIVPSDTVKYEVDKKTGYLMVDRPQKFSNIIPALYGFIPQTYSAEKSAAFCADKTGREGIVGDEDPIDICVLTERNITVGDLLVGARPIGGFRMLDGGEADDKIIAVLKGDEVYGHWKDIADVPEAVISRLKHYFLTYKSHPDTDKNKCEITHTYGKEEAMEVIRLGGEDYQDKYGRINNELCESLMNNVG